MMTPTTSHADIPGGWSIEYHYGSAKAGRLAPSEQGLHVLRVHGDVTRPDALRDSLNAFRIQQGYADGPTILHSPGGVWSRWDAPPKLPEIYATTYCNHAHRVSDGAPVEHGCYVLPPAALRAEIAGNIDDAIRLLEAAKPLREMRRGVKR